MNDPRPIEALLAPLASDVARLGLPVHTDILGPEGLPGLQDVADAISCALAHPTGTAPLADLARERLRSRPDAKAVIVVSDSTRPVPYTGPSGILWPIVEQLLSAGFAAERITILVATGTHRPLTTGEIETLFDGRVNACGAPIRCHDAFDPNGLVAVGRSSTGLEILMDREYVQADLRVLTGLVESHLMAGASGGRKSICPGVVSIDSIRDFHGPSVLAHPSATDLVTSGNPCHEMSLQIARLAPADFIVNVTATETGSITGVFAGDMERAHEAAVETLRRSVGVPFNRLYDIVVTHGGRVGVNHYQSAKAAAIAARVVEPGGRIVVVSDTTDPDPVGSIHYRALMTLLKAIGHEAFERLLLSPDWSFVPDQWQAQMWVRVLRKIRPQNLYYYSPQTQLFEYERLPCRSPRDIWRLLEDAPAEERMALFLRQVLAEIFSAADIHDRGGDVTPVAATGARQRPQGPAIAILPAGPYGVPLPGSGMTVEGCDAYGA